jgi:hypothetical protein
MSNARNLANLLGTNTTIQTANLADDCITSAKLKSDAIQHGDLPSGSVLQVVSVSDGTSRSNSNSAGIDIFGTDASITMKGSSKLLVMFDITGISTSTNDGRFLFQIFKDDSVVKDIGRDAFYSVSDVRAGFSGSFIFTSGHTAGTTYAYNVRFGQIGGGTMYVNRPFGDAGQSTLTLMEIAA